MYGKGCVFKRWTCFKACHGPACAHPLATALCSHRLGRRAEPRAVGQIRQRVTHEIATSASVGSTAHAKTTWQLTYEDVSYGPEMQCHACAQRVSHPCIQPTVISGAMNIDIIASGQFLE